MIESKYFSAKEQSCSCCNQTKDNEVLMNMLEFARIKAGVPFVITSWYRCEKHEESIKNPTSSHIKGKAVDIAFRDNIHKFKILKALLDVGFERVGINDKLKFLHCDIDLDKTRPTLFSY